MADKTSLTHRNLSSIRTDLMDLSPLIDPTEAESVARTVLRATDDLREQYKMIRPALLNNALVNLRVKQRGLCFQWAEDLTKELSKLNLQSIDIHRGVAYQGTWREHSSVVLTARDQPFETGILLDAWRNSGRLIWNRVAEDQLPWRRAILKKDGE